MSDSCTQPQYLNHFNLWGVTAYRIWGMSVCVRARAVHEELDL